MGKLLNRNSTNKGSSSSKYARDCYVLEMFIQGDKSQIEEVFRKEDQTKPSVSESSSDSSNINIIELRVCVQSLVERVNALEKSERNNEKLIKSLQSQNSNLRSQYSNLSDQFDKHSEEYPRKSAHNDSKFKLLLQQIKQLEDIDINACNEKINTLCSEIDRLNKLQVMAQRAVQDLKLSIKPSYANKASPSRTPEYLNNSSVSVTEHEKNLNQSRITEQSDTQIARSEYNKLRNHSETGLTNNSTTYLPTYDQSENNYCNNDEYKIPVRIQGTTEDIKSTNDDIFVGVSRKRSARFYLSGIDSKSTRTGI
jgi:predicted RNase H-like nuclease (RuvC/YqgF family)